MSSEFVDQDGKFNLLALDGKIACGPGGEGVTITKVSIGDGMKKDQLKLEIGGVATDVLVNPRDASDGSDPLPSPMAVSEGIDIEAPDKAIFMAKISELFSGVRSSWDIFAKNSDLYWLAC